MCLHSAFFMVYYIHYKWKMLYGRGTDMIYHVLALGDVTSEAGVRHLARHLRASTGYTFLRWREAGGAKRHLSWELAQQMYSAYQQRTRSWYAQLSEQAMKANDEHVHLRKEIRMIRRRLIRSERAVYAKAIPGSK